MREKAGVGEMKGEEELKNKKQKILKDGVIDNINIRPGDPKGLPDDCFLQNYKNFLLVIKL